MAQVTLVLEDLTPKDADDLILMMIEWLAEERMVHVSDYWVERDPIGWNE
jgi:hypothetical protein